jgi:transposase InsO family protein
LVLSLDRARRLLALHCRLEALRHDEGAGCHRHTRSGVGGVRARSNDRGSPATALSDNGSSYVASDLADWLDKQNIEHVRGAPFHPQTQGTIERWHQTLKNESCLSIAPCPAISNARSRAWFRCNDID